MAVTAKKATLEEVWGIIKELGESHRKTEESLREYKREMQESQRKTEESQRKTEESIRKTQKAIDMANGNFNNKWGRFLENLLQGDLVNLLKERGIEVGRIISRKKTLREDGMAKSEIDILAVNKKDIVLTEVKTTLKSQDVDKFLEKLKNFKNAEPEYKDKTLYGAMAYLGVADRSIKARLRKMGLFLIQSPGGVKGVSIIVSGKNFKPKAF